MRYKYVSQILRYRRDAPPPQIRNGILDHMAAHDYRFRCTTRLAPYDHYLGDRQPVWRCYEGGEILEPGMFITGVFFYTNQPAGSKEAYFNNHNHYQGYIGRPLGWTLAWPLGEMLRLD